MTFKKELTIRSIKILDLGYTSIIYIIPTFYVSIILNKYLFPKINLNKDLESRGYRYKFFNTRIYNFAVRIFCYTWWYSKISYTFT